jgi:hypothetical protein
MSHGITIYNPDNTIVMDSHLKVYSVISRGLSLLGGMNYQEWPVSQYAEASLVFFKPPVGYWFLMTPVLGTTGETTGGTFGFASFNGTPTTNYQWWTNTYPRIECIEVDTNNSLRQFLPGSHGVIINNSINNKIYDSRWPLFNLDSIIFWPASTTNTTTITLPTPPWGTRFYTMYPELIYSEYGFTNNQPGHDVMIYLETNNRIRISAPLNRYTYAIGRDLRGKLIPIYSGYIR